MTATILTKDLDRDWRIRLAAFAHIERLRDDARRVYSRDLRKGFQFEGETVHLVDPSGIFRPRQLKSLGAALSIRTGAPNSRYGAPYDDNVNPSTDFIEYRYRKGSAGDADNRALRLAYELRRPLIWFHGLREGVYEAEFPAWIVDDDQGSRTFKVAIEDEVGPESRVIAGGLPELKKVYHTYEAKKRMHQTRFREMVIGAYSNKCTVCSLGVSTSLIRLLDAAHIRPDRDEQGYPVVSNGLALCKIHHSAYDLNILGIAPDLKIHIRHDILEVIDGPMLEHGIKGMDQRKIRVPRREELQPQEDYLAYRYEGFRAA